jgi:uncharacterized protein YndB with AHSA1/START domain
MERKVTSEVFVKVRAAQVYFAFTRAIGLHEWLCDFSTVAPRPGGRMYLWWHGDFYSAGEYIALEENKAVSFTWFGRGDPAATRVEVTLEEKNDGTQVTLTHILPYGEEEKAEMWGNIANGFKGHWDATLPNLAAVLETGLDKRTFDRPMLGINISDFNAVIAESMGVPVKDGIRLDFLPVDMGAFKAGLCKDDVIVELGGKPITNDFGSLIMALQGKKGGDIVEVIYYRGAEKRTVMMELSKRPIPQIPWEAAGLAKAARAKYDEGLAALENVFAGVSETQADQRINPHEWSAREVLAHLVQTERHWLENLDDVIGGYERVSDDWAGNSSIHVRSTGTAYKTIRGLLDEMKHLSDEMVAYLKELPGEFIARKASYFAVANMLLEGSLPHINSHLEQIRIALKAGK